MDHYILKGKRAYKAPLMEWAEWFETADRIVRQTTTQHSMVSTVFLGLDHSFGGGEPLLFETMVFMHGFEGEDFGCQRYSTWEEAERGHEECLTEVMRREAAAGNLTSLELGKIKERENEQ